MFWTSQYIVNGLNTIYISKSTIVKVWIYVKLKREVLNLSKTNHDKNVFLSKSNQRVAEQVLHYADKLLMRYRPNILPNGVVFYIFI